MQRLLLCVLAALLAFTSAQLLQLAVVRSDGEAREGEVMAARRLNLELPPTSLTLSAFPAPGSLGPIVGAVVGLPTGLFSACLWVEYPTNSFYLKACLPVSSSGGFAIAKWATGPFTDVLFVSLSVQIVSTQTLPIDTRGGALPVSVRSGSALFESFPRGFAPIGFGGNGTFISAHSLSVTAFAVSNSGKACLVSLALSPPFPGATIAAYLQSAGGLYWSKAQPGAAYALSAEGTGVTIGGLFSVPDTDALFTSLLFVALPVGAVALPALGSATAPVPPDALARAVVPRGFYLSGRMAAAAVSPTPIEKSSGSGGGFSTWAIAGGVAGSIALLAGIAVAGALARRRRNSPSPKLKPLLAPISTLALKATAELRTPGGAGGGTSAPPLALNGARSEELGPGAI